METSIEVTEGCVYFADVFPDLTNELLTKSLFGFLYVNIFLLGLLGNCAILWLTISNKHLQTVQNIFIMNLAVGDVLMCLTSLSITPITNIYKTWFFPATVCQLIPLVQGASVLVSTFSLCAIALDRYNLVAHPHHHVLTTRRAYIVDVVLWITSIACCLPYGYYMHVTEVDGLCGQFCTEKWPTPAIRKGYTLGILFLQFLVPFGIMAVCYYTIFKRLRTRANEKIRKLTERSQLLEHQALNGNPSLDDDPTVSYENKQRSSVIAQQRRTTRILASMVLIFGFTWLPHNLFTLIIEYDEEFFVAEKLDHTYFVSMVAHLISITNNVINPVLYAWLNPSFKEILLKSIRGQPKVQHTKTETSVVKVLKPIQEEHNM